MALPNQVIPAIQIPVGQINIWKNDVLDFKISSTRFSNTNTYYLQNKKLLPSWYTVRVTLLDLCRCSECYKILHRRHQRHSRKVNLVKRVTGTYPKEEKQEFLNFQNSQAQQGKQYMKEIKVDTLYVR